MDLNKRNQDLKTLMSILHKINKLQCDLYGEQIDGSTEVLMNIQNAAIRLYVQIETTNH